VLKQVPAVSAVTIAGRFCAGGACTSRDPFIASTGTFTLRRASAGIDLRPALEELNARERDVEVW
jgi:hypothetical protein